jgi:hypothetical protein
VEHSPTVRVWQCFSPHLLVDSEDDQISAQWEVKAAGVTDSPGKAVLGKVFAIYRPPSTPWKGKGINSMADLRGKSEEEWEMVLLGGADATTQKLGSHALSVNVNLGQVR